MIVFLVKRSILHVISDYLNHVKRYFKERFDLDSDIITYQPGVLPPNVKKYKIVIFVQWIDSIIYRRLMVKEFPFNRSLTLKERKALAARGMTPQGTTARAAIPRSRSAPAIIRRQPPKRAQPKRVQPKQPQPKQEEPEKPNVFLLNTEQATMRRYVSQTINNIKNYRVSVIDYSMENIILLRKHLPNTKFIHLPFPLFMKPLTPKKHAVVSLMSSPHRVSACRRLGVPVTNFNGRWGPARDQLIRDSKVLVNVHFKPGDYGIFESIRCYHALEMRTLVISEPSVSQNNVLLKDYIIFAPVGQMAAKLKDVLANYQTYYDKYFSQERIVELQERMEITYRKAIDEIIG